MSAHSFSLMHCGNCNGQITAGDLFLSRICPYCGSDLLESLSEFNRQIHEPPSGRAKGILDITEIYLTDRLWDLAIDSAKMAIKLDYYYYYGHLYLLLAEMKASTIVELAYAKESFADRSSYLMFCRHAPLFLRIEVDFYLQMAQQRLYGNSDPPVFHHEAPPETHATDPHREFYDEGDTYSSYEDIYRHACDLHLSATSYRDFKEAAELFESIPHYKDSDAQLAVCNKMYSTHRTESFMANFLKGSLLFSFFLVALRVLAGFT